MANTDELLASISDPRFWLCGDENCGVALHCRDCWDGGRPLAHYDPHGPAYNDPQVANVTTIPALWDAVAHHLTTAHPVT